MRLSLSQLLTIAALATATPLSAQPKAASYIGVSSCTAVACHGSPTAGRPAWQSAYTVWATQDRHSLAYLTLNGERSQRIVHALHGSNPSAAEYRKLLHDRCIGCHATPGAAFTILVEGVSCEACHGPAGDWRELHTLTSWSTKPLHEKQSLGQTSTVDLSVRAAVCVRCHVGPGKVGDQVHDMNHDLIAAGHPRLNFEFSAYLAGMPAHWNVDQDRSRHADFHAGFDAQAWLAGQTASLRAALSLLKERATSSSKTAVWPEFAEYDCYSCHRELTPTASDRSSRGRPVWSTWHTPIPSWLAKRFSTALPADLDALRIEMMRPLPHAEVAEKLVNQSLISLDEWERQLAQMPPKSTSLLSGLSRQPPDWRNWDEPTQWYLAVAALTGSYQPSYSPHPSQPALAAFRERLELNELDPESPQFRQALSDLLEQLK